MKNVVKVKVCVKNSNILKIVADQKPAHNCNRECYYVSNIMQLPFDQKTSIPLGLTQATFATY